jgi:hypothetical protein
MKQLIKEIPRAIVISISIFFVLLLIRLITGNKVELNHALLVNFGYTMLYGFSLYFANAAIFIYLDKVFKADRFTPKRILIGFVSSFLISIGVIFLLRIFEDVLVEGVSLSDLWLFTRFIFTKLTPKIKSKSKKLSPERHRHSLKV